MLRASPKGGQASFAIFLAFVLMALAIQTWLGPSGSTPGSLPGEPRARVPTVSSDVSPELSPKDTLSVSPDNPFLKPANSGLEASPAPTTPATPSTSTSEAVSGTASEALQQALHQSQAPGSTPAQIPDLWAPFLKSAPPKLRSDGLTEVRFGFLRDFTYRPAHTREPGEDFKFPEAVKRLDGVRIWIAGYQMPIDVEGGNTPYFALLSEPPSCCFGGNLSMNGWAMVELPEGKTAQYLREIPVWIQGVLHVQEFRTEDGYVSHLFEIDAEDVFLEDLDDGGFDSVVVDRS